MESTHTHNYKLVVSYDGTNFKGWQTQKNGNSIQAKLQEVLSTILRGKVKITGSGRTDSGVHAKAQVANFFWHEEIDTFRMLASVNGLLPIDIRLHSVEVVPLEFHARYSARSKEYHYHITLDRFQSPFKRLYACHQKIKVDKEALRNAASYFLGTHDFTAFANTSEDGAVEKDPVRSISRLDVFDTDDGLRLEFEGDGFLYKMVRNIAGTLIDVGIGRIKAEDIPEIFSSKDRRKAGRSAPAEGLFLVKVNY